MYKRSSWWQFSFRFMLILCQHTVFLLHLWKRGYLLFCMLCLCFQRRVRLHFMNFSLHFIICFLYYFFREYAHLQSLISLKQHIHNLDLLKCILLLNGNNVFPVNLIFLQTIQCLLIFECQANNVARMYTCIFLLQNLSLKHTCIRK